MDTELSNWIWKKKNCVLKKHTCCRMIILYQGDFKEHIQKWVRLLFCTAKNCWRKDQVCIHFVPSQ